jgi:hypothetical protein
MRTKRRTPGLYATCLLALTPTVYIRCSTPGDPPPTPAPRSTEVAAEGRRELVDELRHAVAEHAERAARAEDPAGRSEAERTYHDATGPALGRLREAARAAAGPCAAPGAVMAEVASVDALAAALRDEFDRHLASSEAGEGEPADEERRHAAEALDLLDRLDGAYGDVERGARHRASVGCLWQGGV